MKYILLSTDGPTSVYEVPDKVANNLRKYCIEFCQWTQTGPKAKLFRKGYIPEPAFIDYINTVLCPNYIPKAKWVENLGYIADEAEIPSQFKNCPSFNF